MKQKLWNNNFGKLNLSINDLDENLLKPSDHFFVNPHEIGNYALFELIALICIVFSMLHKYKVKKIRISNAQGYVAVRREAAIVEPEIQAIPLQKINSLANGSQNSLTVKINKSSSKGSEPHVVFTMK
jgi:hypothetical protein